MTEDAFQTYYIRDEKTGYLRKIGSVTAEEFRQGLEEAKERIERRVPMTNQTDLIREVRAALEAATPGPWEQDDGPYVLDNNGKVVCRFWHMLGEYPNHEDNAHLIANSPTWLQQLTDRLEEVVKALEWYGDIANWYQYANSLDIDSAALNDVGELARTTLKRIKGENG